MRFGRVGVLVAAVTVVVAVPATAEAKPSCFGKKATIVSHKKTIKGTHHGDVIVGSVDGFLGADGDDTIVGDSYSRKGTARGGANDHAEGAEDKDLVIGDSFSKSGKALGSGNDVLNSGPKNDVVVGDNYTVSGTA